MQPDATRHEPKPRGFGITAGYGRAILEPLAAEVARLGYETLWANDSARPEADGLADLAVIHAAAPDLDLGVGVIPLDKRPPEQIAADIRRLDLPLDRLRLGVGSGAELARPLDLVRRGVADLRSLLPTATIFVAALGPRMCDARRRSRRRRPAELGAAGPTPLGRRARRPPAPNPLGRAPGDVAIWTYVRAAVGPAARERLGREAARYATSPAYGRQFTEMGAPFDEVGVWVDTSIEPRAPLSVQLESYRPRSTASSVRALPAEPALDDLLAIARAAVA